MSTPIQTSPTSFSTTLRKLLCMAALAGIAVTGVVVGQSQLSTVANLPLVDLSPDPIYQRGVSAKPTLTLALSVEYPTVGAAYVNGQNSRLDDTFKTENEYLGYFDQLGCYTYQQDATNGWFFVRTGSADKTSHRCTGNTTSFSGNFLNWASASAIDILRIGLTGGDRIVDTETLTVLQRAVLPDGTTSGNPSFYNSEDFPTKHVAVANTDLSGIVPAGFSGGRDIYVANCKNMMFMGSSATGSCGSPGANAAYRSGGFQVRVSVCTTDDAASRETYMPGYCRKYPNGNYKPVGNLQKYADRVRVAVFGYLLDNNRETYGGVLRAPMAYLGKEDFDANYLLKSNPNPYMEWVENTGQFKANPRNANQTVNGAINYINQFGRSGSYKGFDPMSELYYESLRYLRGMPPTLAATSSVSPGALNDGFPVYNTVSTSPDDIPTKWSDPHPKGSKLSDYSCVSNNVLTIGDVNTHNDRRIPGDGSRGSVASATEDQGEENFNQWTDVVGKFEAMGSLTYTDGNGNQGRNTADLINPTPNTALNDIANTSPSWGDNSSYYLAGMAYWAHTHDIRAAAKTGDRARPGMRVKTYAIDVNEYGAQTDFANHSRNQYYLAAKYGGFKDYSTDDQGNPFAVTPANEAKAAADKYLRNGSWKRDDSPQNQPEPKDFFLGNEAKQMLAALDNIFAEITKDSGNIAGLSMDGRRVAETNTIYQGRFDPDNWHGDVVSYKLSDILNGAKFDPTSSSVNWRATDKLDTMNFENRHIYVGTPPGSSTSAVEFTWPSIAAVPGYGDIFRKSPDPMVSTPDTDTVAGLRVDYLRGDHSKEQPNGDFRARSSRMGDVVNSAVVYSGKPTTAISDPNYVANFVADDGIYTHRRPAVFVGANDGMLHAFDAADGTEMFSYIPSWLVPKLNQLTWPKYQHTSYVDATPTVAEADLGGGDWRTVLVGGTGGGGQGVYALDVSSPGTVSGRPADQLVLWEFTDADDADLGNVVGRVRLLKIKTGSGYKTFAVFGGGVNNYANDGHASTTGDPYIFLLDLGKSRNAPWSLNNNYFKVKLPKNDALEFATGVLNVSAVTDMNRAAIALYAGDLHGQLWNIKLSNLSDLSARLIFQAERGSKPQPISSAPALFRVEGRIIAVTATGKFLETTDKAVAADGSYTVQSVYAIYDSGALIKREDLKPIDISSDTWLGENFPWGAPAVDASGTHTQYAGWYFDFPGSASTGEREIGLIAALPGAVVFNTMIPADNSCSTGKGATYVLSLFTGGGKRVIRDDGLADPLIRQLDPVAGTEDNVRRVHTKVGADGIACGSTDCKKIEIDISRTLHRISWRDIANFEEIKNSKPTASTSP